MNKSKLITPPKGFVDACFKVEDELDAAIRAIPESEATRTNLRNRADDLRVVADLIGRALSAYENKKPRTEERGQSY